MSAITNAFSYAIKSFSGGALTAFGGIVVTLAAPHIIKMLKDHVDALQAKQEDTGEFFQDDPDLC